MPQRARPMLSIRLIGPTDTVTTHKQHLLAHLAEVFGDTATCRTSTHAAKYTNETRVYLTIIAKEVPHHDTQ